MRKKMKKIYVFRGRKPGRRERGRKKQDRMGLKRKEGRDERDRERGQNI